MNSLRTIALTSIKSILLKPGKSKANKRLVLSILADISQLGFKLDQPAILLLNTLSSAELKVTHRFLISELRTIVGADVNYSPLFVNFPEDVPEENEYLLRRLIGYFEGVLWDSSPSAITLSCGCTVNPHLFDISVFGACPICQHQTNETQGKKKTSELKQKTELKLIKLCTEVDVENYLRNIISSKSSISEKSKLDLESYFIEAKDEAINLLPAEIPVKEVAAFVCSLLAKHTSHNDHQSKYFGRYLTTSTDILRFAAQLSGGDASLATKTVFKLTNKERRIIISRLESSANPEDMLRHREKWLRLGEYLHIGTKRTKYPLAFNAMKILRKNHKEIVTFNKTVHAEVENFQKSKDPTTVLNLLKSRPGELGRKLDLLLRYSKNPDVVLTKFKEVVENIPTAMLLKMSTYFKNRHKKSAFRYFIPKGTMAKIFFTEEDSRSFLTLPVKKNLLKIIEKSLLDRFSKRSKLSKVFIDPKLKNYIVPLTQRSSSKSLDTVERGSQIEYDEKAKTIRMFVYWHENDKTGRIDVDLSAIGFDDKWKALAQLSWTNLASLGSTHSGDIQSAPNGASEFIDINLDKFEAAGIRYVAMSIYAFTHQHFSQFQCFAGIMPRQNPNSGEAYEPKTVKNILDITADGKIAMPLILDLKRKKIVWCDVALAKSGNRTETTSHKIANMGKSVIAMNHQSPNLFDLLSLHVKARSGEVVTEFHKQDIYDLVLEESFARNISEILRNWI